MLADLAQHGRCSELDKTPVGFFEVLAPEVLQCLHCFWVAIRGLLFDGLLDQTCANDEKIGVAKVAEQFIALDA